MDNNFKDLAFYAFIAIAVYFIYKYITRKKNNKLNSTSSYSNTTTSGRQPYNKEAYEAAGITVTGSDRTASGTATSRTTANGSGVYERTSSGTATNRQKRTITYENK